MGLCYGYKDEDISLIQDELENGIMFDVDDYGELVRECIGQDDEGETIYTNNMFHFYVCIRFPKAYSSLYN